MPVYNADEASRSLGHANVSTFPSPAHLNSLRSRILLGMALWEKLEQQSRHVRGRGGNGHFGSLGGGQERFRNEGSRSSGWLVGENVKTPSYWNCFAEKIWKLSVAAPVEIIGDAFVRLKLREMIALISLVRGGRGAAFCVFSPWCQILHAPGKQACIANLID